jgi:hypothetical protein
MSYSAEDNQKKIEELAQRLDVVERRAFAITKKDVAIVVVCSIVISAAIVMCLIGQMFMIYQADKLYSLLKSV